MVSCIRRRDPRAPNTPLDGRFRLADGVKAAGPCRLHRPSDLKRQPSPIPVANREVVEEPISGTFDSAEEPGGEEDQSYIVLPGRGGILCR